MDSVGSGIFRFANEAFVRLIILVAVLFLHAYAIAQEPKSRSAIPDEAAQTTALSVVAEVYKNDYEKAKTPFQKVELAKKLLQEGTATKDDPVGRFVLFRVARDIAAQQGDLATSFTAIDRISGEYEVDQMQLHLDAASTAVKAPKLARDHQACAALLAPLIDGAIAVDRYEQAKSFAELSLVCAREDKDFESIKQMVARLKEIDDIASEFKNVAEAKSALEAKPTDPEANFTVGKFLCFVKGDWKRGVTMLALGDNEELKAASVMELDTQPDALELGDAWWKIAESQERTAKARTQAHAAEWYRKALPGLSGLTKARIERILASLDPLRDLLISHRWKRVIRKGASTIDIIEFTFMPDGTCVGKRKDGFVSALKRWTLEGDEIVFAPTIRMRFKDRGFGATMDGEEWNFTIIGPK